MASGFIFYGFKVHKLWRLGLVLLSRSAIRSCISQSEFIIFALEHGCIML